MANNVEVVQDAFVNDRGELILQMSSGNQINAGLVARPKPEVVDAYVEGDKVILKFNDDTTREAFDTAELGFKDVRDVYLDGYDVYAEYLDGEVKHLGNVFLETNSEIYTTYMNRDDGHMYGIRYNGEIETIGDLEKYVGDRFSESIREITSNDLDEVILHTTDGKEYNIGKIYFKDYKRDESLREVTNVWVDSVTGILKITYSDGETSDAGPARLVNINGQPIVLGNAFINEIGHLNLEVLKISPSGEFIMRTQPVPQPDGTVGFEEVFDTRLIDAGKVKGMDGVDGTVYERVDVLSDGMLTFTTTDGIQHQAGYLLDRSVEDARIDPDGVLVLILSNGEELRTSNVLGKDGMDGKNITGASIDEEGMLFLHFDEEDIPDIPAGEVSFPVEVSMSQNEEDEIIFTMSNGDTFNAGVLPGVRSKYITEMENRIDGVYVKYSDKPNEWVMIGSLSYKPKSLELVNGRIQLEFSNGQVITTTQSIQGKDGDGIVSVEMQGRDLVVNRTVNNGTGREQDIFPDVKGAGIDTITYDQETHSITFTLENGEETNIPLPQLRHGIGVANIFKDTRDIVFEMDDSTTYRLPNMVGEGIRFISLDREQGVLTFRNTLTDELYEISAIEGQDGTGVERISLSGEDLVIEMNNQDDVIVPLPRGNVHHRTVDDIVLEENLNRFELKISFVEEDKEDIVVPFPRPRNGDTIENVFIDSNNALVFEVSSIEEPIVFPTIKGVDGIGIDGVDFDSDDNSIIFNLSDGSTHTVLIPAPVDGVSIDSFVLDDETNTVTTTLTDGRSIDVPIEYGVDGVGLSDITYADEELSFTLTDGTIRTFAAPKGVDGTSVTGITYENQTIHIFVDGAISEQIPFRTGNDGTSITDIYMDDRDLVIETDIPEGESTKTLRYPMIKGKDAVDGVSVSSIDESENGIDLNVSLDNGDTIVLSGAARRVSNVSVNEDYHLVVEYNNGDIQTSLTPIRGRDGVGTGISDINIDTDTLNIEVSDATGVVDNLAVNLSRFTLERTEVNGDGELVAIYQDGSQRILGQVEGEKGNWLKSASVSSNDILTVVVTDGVNDSLRIIGNVKGSPGVHATGIDIDRKMGDMEIIFSDGSRINVGNIKDDRTLSTWNSSKTPYEKDVVVIHNERMFLSVSATSTEPPSSAWREVAFNDNIIEVLAPVTMSPNSENVSTVQAALQGSAFRAFNVEREYREFELYDQAGTTRLFTIRRNANSVTLPTSLNLATNTLYRWRIRDKAVSGYISQWSEMAEFQIVEDLITPTMNMVGNLNDMVLVTQLELSLFKTTLGNDSVPVSFTWEIVDENDVGVFEETSTEPTIIVPVGVLEEGKSYSAKGSYQTTNNASGWSNEITFTTTEEMGDIIKTPVVTYKNGNPLEVNIDEPIFVSTRAAKSGLLATPEYYDLSINHSRSDWEIVDAVSGDMVISFYDVSDILSICAEFSYLVGREYRIRTRHHIDNIGSSQWSEWLPFSVNSVIEKPLLTTEGDINDFIPDTEIVISSFSGVNVGSVIETEIEVRDADTGNILYNMAPKDTGVKRSFKLFVPKWEDGLTGLVIRARHKTTNAISEWSDTMSVVLRSGTYSEFTTQALNLVSNNAPGAVIYNTDFQIVKKLSTPPNSGTTNTNNVGTQGFFFDDKIIFFGDYVLSNTKNFIYDMNKNTLTQITDYLTDNITTNNYSREKINKSTKITTNNDKVVFYRPQSTSRIVIFDKDTSRANKMSYFPFSTPYPNLVNVDHGLNLYITTWVTGEMRLGKYNTNGDLIDEWIFPLPNSQSVSSTWHSSAMVENNGNIFVVFFMLNELLIYRINTLGIVSNERIIPYSTLTGEISTINEQGRSGGNPIIPSIITTNTRNVLSLSTWSGSAGGLEYWLISLDLFNNDPLIKKVDRHMALDSDTFIQWNVTDVVYERLSYVEDDVIYTPIIKYLVGSTSPYFTHRVDAKTLDILEPINVKHLPNITGTVGDNGVSSVNSTSFSPGKYE